MNSMVFSTDGDLNMYCVRTTPALSDAFCAGCLYTLSTRIAAWYVVLGDDGAFHKYADLRDLGVELVAADTLDDCEFVIATIRTCKRSEQVNRVQTEDF